MCSYRRWIKCSRNWSHILTLYVVCSEGQLHIVGRAVCRPGQIIPVLLPIILLFYFPRTSHYSHNLVLIILDYSQ